MRFEVTGLVDQDPDTLLAVPLLKVERAERESALAVKRLLMSDN
jgi:hypothetical protein